MTWRCDWPDGCGEALDGGDNGPYLDAVGRHLREAHADLPFWEAWERFKHRWESERPLVGAARAQVGTFHPPTAQQAASRVLPRSGSDRRRVYDFIVERGEQGATDDELEVALDLPHQTASARRNGLRDDGWLADSGRKRPTRSGADAIVWVSS